MKKILLLCSLFIAIMLIIIVARDNNTPSIPSTDTSTGSEHTSLHDPKIIAVDDLEKVNNSMSGHSWPQSNYNPESYEIPKLVSDKPEQILSRVGYTVSYNTTTKNANWVAWHLTKEHTDGPYTRDNIPYFEDTEIIGARQVLSDWDNLSQPIDHGHLCPAGDNKWSQDAMEQSFLLSNMCPQNRNLNQVGWERLESRCRGWARHYGEIFIVTGPIFYSKSWATIGNEVAIPDAFFKAVLRLKPHPKALAFIYPNKEGSSKLDKYIQTVDKVEEICGIDLFFNLPDEIENEVESNSNLREW